MSRARKRRSPDVLRMGMAMSYPGIDPRSWASTGRIDDDPQAYRWNRFLGWIADVTLYGGTLDGESEIPCRVMGSNMGDGFGEFFPPGRTCEVQVALNGGDPEENPVILGSLTNQECAAPTEINEITIKEGSESSESSNSSVSPFDTEIKKSPHNRREEYDGDFTVWSKNRSIKTKKEHLVEAEDFVLVVSKSVSLGKKDADEPFVKGSSHASTLSDLADALDEFATSVTGVVDSKLPAGSPSSPFALKLKAAVAAFKLNLVEGKDLSSKIKGE